MADSDPFALWNEAAAALEQLLRAMRAAPPAAEGVPGAAAVLTQGYLVALSAGLRCLSRLSRTAEAHRADLAALVLGQADRDRLAALMRTLAHELGDAAVEEAGRFREELMRLAEGFASPSRADPASPRPAQPQGGKGAM